MKMEKQLTSKLCLSNGLKFIMKDTQHCAELSFVSAAYTQLSCSV